MRTFGDSFFRKSSGRQDEAAEAQKRNLIVFMGIRAPIPEVVAPPSTSRNVSTFRTKEIKKINQILCQNTLSGWMQFQSLRVVFQILILRTDQMHAGCCFL